MGESGILVSQPSSWGSGILPPSHGRRCPEGAEVGSYREMKAGIGFTELLPAEQPLREGARQRRRMDPRGGLKTNVKRSISRACHFERSERSLPFAVRDSRFPHMCRALLRFSHLSFIPLEPYPARFARHLPHGGRLTKRDMFFFHLFSCPPGYFCFLPSHSPFYRCARKISRCARNDDTGGSGILISLTFPLGSEWRLGVALLHASRVAP